MRFIVQVSSTEIGTKPELYEFDNINSAKGFANGYAIALHSRSIAGPLQKHVNDFLAECITVGKITIVVHQRQSAPANITTF